MTPEELVEKTSVQSEALRIFVQQQTTRLADFGRRLQQIVQQLRKNIEVRDTNFAEFQPIERFRKQCRPSVFERENMREK